MNKKTNTKRALILSALCMVLCVSMLIGSTFAWFTDNASVNVNKIESGTLDIRLLDGNNVATANSLEGKTLTFAKAEGAPADEEVLFEPGAKYALTQAWIYNAGNLHAKYQVQVSGIDGDDELAKYLTVYVGDESFNLATALANNGIIKENTIAPGDYDTFGTIEIGMDTTVGNGAQGKSLSGIAIAVKATQAAVEYDSFNHTYDEQAAYDENVVVTAEELRAALVAAADAGSGDGIVNIANSFTLAEGETWTPVKVDGYNGAGVVTVEGNGNTIRGLNAPLFSGGFAGNSGIIIKDLTIADSTIVSTNTLGSGAFIEAIDSMQTITLTNCHLVNSSVTGSRTGGLIGWNAGYNNVNDGPVKTYVTIENCSVIDCTITGDGSVGGIVGHAGNNAWTWNTITNCTVSNTNLTSNDDSYRVGAIVGTANVGEVTITSCTSTGNTIKQNNNGTEIARPDGQSELYGRFVPDDTGKLTIDGNAIK